MIGVDVGEDRETVQGWATRLAIPFALLLDDRSETLRLFGLRGHPNTVLIDRENRVVGLVRGERDWQSVAARRVVQHLLQGGR